jgi:integrase
MPQETAVWLAKVSSTIHARLVKVGLVKPRDEPQSVQLSDFLKGYVNTHCKLKPNTRRNYETTERLLEKHFGPKRLVASIHAGHARDYREWLIGQYAPATTSREIKRARQFFEYARDCRLISENPFAKIKAGPQRNTSRKEFVNRPQVTRVLESCPDTEWQLIVVLARYGGLRIPSELVNLTWADINWEQNRIRVKVPKKEHLDGHGTREVPIFPEIRPYLTEAFEEATVGSSRVVPRARLGNTNLREGLVRILKRASVDPWPKLFQNLRASRETELMRTDPANVVYAWLGNSREVAEDHYLMVTDDDFDRAAGKAVQNPVHSDAVSGLQTPSDENETAVLPACANNTAVEVPPRGVEHGCISSRPVASYAAGDAKTDAVAPNGDYWVRRYDNDLEQLVTVWDSLTASIRKKILKLVAASTET